MYKLIISLYIDNPVRRTSDYTKMLINTKDNGKDNLLIFTKHKNNLYIIIGRIPQKQVHKHIL